MRDLIETASGWLESTYVGSWLMSLVGDPLWMAAIVGGIAAIAAIFQLRRSRIAQESRSTPYVGVSLESRQEHIGHSIKYLVIKNYGSTPAFDVKVELRKDNPDLPGHPRDMNLSRMTLMPGQSWEGYWAQTEEVGEGVSYTAEVSYGNPRPSLLRGKRPPVRYRIPIIWDMHRGRMSVTDETYRREGLVAKSIESIARDLSWRNELLSDDKLEVPPPRQMEPTTGQLLAFLDREHNSKTVTWTEERSGSYVSYLANGPGQ